MKKSKNESVDMKKQMKEVEDNLKKLAEAIQASKWIFINDYSTAWC